MGWSAIIKYGDYTSVLINLTQLCLIFNIFFVFYGETYPDIMIIAGFVIMITGMVFNLLVRRDLGKNWVPLSKTTEGQELVTSGVYSKIRHPFYASILILFLGVAVMAGNIYALLFFMLFIISIWIRIKKEEEELIKKFGDEYGIYMEEVPMLLPKL
ncbi:MAG TPA: isoprenylcysteine carboxylmethyltransferase family protein [Methanobacterium sp.]|nr:isoprenylcysteine carboxylmethyltransferase family protein [Methanobacterium sp.]